jgi:hypothetical protein
VVVVEAAFDSHSIAPVVQAVWRTNPAIPVQSVVYLKHEAMKIVRRTFNEEAKSMDVRIPFKHEKSIDLALEVHSICRICQIATD